MTDIVRIDDIVSSSDIARLCGVTGPAVSNWKQRFPNFPKPFAFVNDGHTPLYRKSDVVEWFMQEHGLEKLPEIYKLIRERQEG